MPRAQFAFFACIALLLAGCHRLSDREKQLVGTWRATLHDRVVTMVLADDHKFEIHTSDNSVQLARAAGTWRVEGNVLVTRTVREQDIPAPVRERREKLPEDGGTLQVTDPDSTDSKITLERAQ